MSVPRLCLGLASLGRAGAVRGSGLGRDSCPCSAWCPPPLLLSERTLTQGDGLQVGPLRSASSVALATRREAGGCPRGRAGPFCQSPGDDVAAPRRGELHLAEGAELAYTRRGGLRSLCTQCEDTVTVSLLLSLRWQWRHPKYHPDLRLG